MNVKTLVNSILDICMWTFKIIFLKREFFNREDKVCLLIECYYYLYFVLQTEKSQENHHKCRSPGDFSTIADFSQTNLCSLMVILCILCNSPSHVSCLYSNNKLLTYYENTCYTKLYY